MVPSYTVSALPAGIAYSKDFALKPLFDFYILKLKGITKIHSSHFPCGDFFP